MDRDSLDGLATFRSVAERRSFTKAAAELRVTRAAVSQTIKALERRLGVTLLARTTRDVGLTEAGLQLLERITPALAAIEAAVEGLQDLSGAPAGLLRLNVPRLAVLTVIAPLIPSFVAAYPQVTIEIFSDDRLSNIVADGFDAGVRLGELIAQDMISVRLTPPDRLLVVGSPSYLANYGVPTTPRQLKSHQCINYRHSSRGNLYAWEFERGGEELEVSVEGSLIVNDSDLKIGAALQGLGLAYELQSVVQPYLDQGLLRSVLDDWSAETPGFFLYFPSRAQVMPKLRAFIEHARWRE